MSLKPEYREQRKEPVDVNMLREEFLYAVERRDSNIFRRQRLNVNTRYCVWANQSIDGRKWTAPKGEDIFPWRGASDARVNLVDTFIREDVAMMKQAWRRSQTMVTPTEVNDTSDAVRMTQALRWMKYTQMAEADRQVELAANYMLERGTAIMGVFWEKRTQLGYEVIDMEDLSGELQGLVQQLIGEERIDEDRLDKLTELPSMLLDPARDKEAAQLVHAQIYPDVPMARLRKAVKDLRETGQARFPRPYLVCNRPTVVALAPNEHVFVPPETTDLQKARAIFRRELVSETDLRERVTSEEWDEAWVEEVIRTQRGRVTADFDGNVFRGSARQSANGRGVLNTERLFEVVHAFQRQSDEEGVPGIYYSCFSPGLTRSDRHNQLYAYSELLNYDHGEYPFILLERETKSELIDDSRGYGEIANTWQHQIKVEWDSRVDRTSIATLPPMYHKPQEAPTQWGPGARVPAERADDVGFMETPKYDPGSQEMEASVFKWASRYFGRLVGEENAQESSALKQELIDKFLSGIARMDEQTLQLMQQFMPDAQYIRVVGSEQAKPIHLKKEEIQGKFDVSVTFNAESLDPTKVEAKIGLLEKAIQMDTTGRVDRNKVLEVTFQMIDPNLAERVLAPAEDAAMREVDDEKNVFAQMFAGVPVDIRPGQAYQLRLQTLQQILQNNPLAQQRLQQDEQFKGLIENRLKQLTQQLQQQANARTGVLGAQSAKDMGMPG